MWLLFTSSLAIKKVTNGEFMTGSFFPHSFWGRRTAFSEKKWEKYWLLAKVTENTPNLLMFHMSPDKPSFRHDCCKLNPGLCRRAFWCNVAGLYFSPHPWYGEFVCRWFFFERHANKVKRKKNPSISFNLLCSKAGIKDGCIQGWGYKDQQLNNVSRQQVRSFWLLLSILHTTLYIFDPF